MRILPESITSFYFIKLIHYDASKSGTYCEIAFIFRNHCLRQSSNIQVNIIDIPNKLNKFIFLYNFYSFKTLILVNIFEFSST